jgi:hypothetical protein
MQGLTLRQEANKTALGHSLGLEQLAAGKERTAAEERWHGKTAEATMGAAQLKGQSDLKNTLMKTNLERLGKKDELNYQHQLKLGELGAEGKLNDPWTQMLQAQAKTGLPINPLEFAATFHQAVAAKNPAAMDIHTKLMTLANGDPTQYQQGLFGFANDYKTDPAKAMSSLGLQAQKARVAKTPAIAAPGPSSAQFADQAIPFEKTLPGMLQGMGTSTTDDFWRQLMP